MRRLFGAKRQRSGSLCLAGLVLALSNGAVAADGAATPWPPAYKLRPDEKDRLTAADVVGPDGLVYPDWRHAGVPGGIPDVPERARIRDFGAKPDDGLDDGDALEKGIRAVAAKGGGALVLDAGTYHLDRPLIITDDGTVLRGQGADKTKIVFRYGLPEKGAVFFRPRPGEVVGPDSWIQAHGQPERMSEVILKVNDVALTALPTPAARPHWGGRFNIAVRGTELIKAVGPGKHELKAVSLKNGKETVEAAMTVEVNPAIRAPRGAIRFPSGGTLGAITFCGDRATWSLYKLAKDGRRGETEITLQDAKGLSPGDAIFLTAPATERWNKLVRNACLWGSYRIYQFRIEQIDGARLRLNQPLRFDFPLIDGPTARKIYPIRRCGVENLRLVQTKKVWTCGVLFETAWECWARGVAVQKAGRFPLYAENSKWCEIRDCTMDDAWYHGGGGTAYVGWQTSCDCLMENVKTTAMRHAPCVQWGASGNVIRKSTFLGSDMQWHAGWTNENLFEQCVVEVGMAHGAYGYGAWASPPEDTAHGPNGPRNVIYNCDIRSPRTGLWMGGMNEAWLILHNRFIVQNGAGVFAKTCSFDHVIGGNVFVLRDARQPAAVLQTADCVGIEFIDNRVFGGNGKLVEGQGRPLIDKGNTFAPLPREAPPRPAVQVPSIFKWQRGQ